MKKESETQYIAAHPIYTDVQLDSFSNTFFDYDPEIYMLIDTDTDVYTKVEGKYKCILKYRKNVIPQEMCDTLWESLKGAAPLQRGRAESAGIPKEGEIYSNIVSKSTGKNIRQLNSKARSGIIGYYDNKSFMGHKYIKDDGEMCRLTSFSRKNLEKYKKSLPCISYIDNLYKQLTPNYYKKQRSAMSKINKKYHIEDTVYTTVTVNKNFRTALHKDKGDYVHGFGNLVVIDRGEYTGAYTMIPKYGIAVDCKSTDFLLFDVHEYHCNSQKIGNSDRMSLVLYLRERMIKSCPK